MIRLLLTLAIGICLSITGFFILVGLGAESIEMVWVGLAFFLFVGPAICLIGCGLYAFRRVTRDELAATRSDNISSWQFRPVGLLIVIVAIGTVSGILIWAERYIPDINAGRKPTAHVILAIACLSLMAFRRIRALIFYTGE